MVRCCHRCNIVKSSIEVTISHKFHHRCSSEENTAVAAISYKVSLVFEIPSNIQSSPKKKHLCNFVENSIEDTISHKFHRRCSSDENTAVAAIYSKFSFIFEIPLNILSSHKTTWSLKCQLKSVATISSKTQSWFKFRRQFRHRFNFA